MISALAALLAAAGLMIAWLRRGKRKAESRAATATREKERAEVGRAADREADRRETAAHVEADRAIPTPTSSGWEAVGEIDAARRKHDAARRVRAKLGKAGRR